ncbi:concanavalin A-like lectin/glucanase domain-containing protein [Crepidotus variabilis]|uniref:Concanavalin A-like lectin/glucanase domain-containing protein n=1 Tax=Crepidotus variabilis TaxID=179855 RepID=A0A9P6JP83_9AGAR|nr:concanavalin A-like lectin/glucanase domain-containing protein [Crepidotus variabilis]
MRPPLWSGGAFLFLFSVFLSKPVTSYNLVADYAGSTFFDNWIFYGNYDNLTLGDVIWQDEANATADGLAFVNTAGNAVIKVDNTTNVPYNIKRNSVRITTQAAFEVGSLFIADFVHMPWGCSVWPAYWTKGIDWPEGGEIDILEGINLNTQNQMALHTRSGCLNVPPAPGAQIGQTGPLNCTAASGCTVVETKPNSYGQAFNQAGGGVFATQFDVTGVFIWFWSRPNIPASIQAAASSTGPFTSLADWGVPSASYPSTGSCNTSEYFVAQNLVLDITLCGEWAGEPSIYLPQCASQGPTGICYNDNVIGPGSPKYDNAYFEIQYVKAYSLAPAVFPANNTGNNTGSISSDGGTNPNDPTQNTPSEATNSKSISVMVAILGVSIMTGVFLV